MGKKASSTYHRKPEQCGVSLQGRLGRKTVREKEMVTCLRSTIVCLVGIFAYLKRQNLSATNNDLLGLLAEAIELVC